MSLSSFDAFSLFNSVTLFKSLGDERVKMSQFFSELFPFLLRITLLQCLTSADLLCSVNCTFLKEGELNGTTTKIAVYSETRLYTTCILTVSLTNMRVNHIRKCHEK